MSNIVVININRSVAGITIPFDKLYFFRREDRDLIPKAFGYALVLPADEDLLRAVAKLKPKEINHFKHWRDDKALHQRTKIDDALLDGRSHNNKQIAEWWDETVLGPYDFNNRVAVVPVLTSTMRKKVFPRYLASKKWYSKQKPRRYSYGREKPTIPAISELAYLATPKPAPEDKIRPICSICNRSLLSLQGKCVPGQIVCYKSLDLSTISAAPPDTNTETDTDNT